MSMTENRSPARKIHSGGQTRMKICELHPPERCSRAGMTIKNNKYLHMKKIRYSILGLLVCSITLFMSCETDFEDINKSPATVYTVDPITFLHNVQLQASTAGSTWMDSYATKL